MVNDQSHMLFGPGLGFARNTPVINSALIEAQAGLHPGVQLFATEDSDEKVDTSSPWLRTRNTAQLSSGTVPQHNRSTHGHSSSLPPPSTTYQDNSRSHFELASHEHPGLRSGNWHYEQYTKRAVHMAIWLATNLVRALTPSHTQPTLPFSSHASVA